MNGYRPQFGPDGWTEGLSQDEIAVVIEMRQRNGGNPTGVTVINGASIRPQPVEWLWPGWLARGKVHLLAGAPGTGKTSAALAFTATVTIGGRWPDGSQADVGHALIWSGEDDPADTLVPRLLACGADLSNMHFVTGMTDDKGPRNFDPSTDIDALVDHMATMNPAPSLLLVDPIVSAVAGDSHKNAEVRRSLQPLVDLASTRRCAVLGITHFSKGSGGRDPVERMTGSLAFGALVRIGMVAAKIPDDQGGGRILARAKNNLGPDTGGFVYDMDVCEPLEGIQTTRILWGEVIEGTAREILSKAEMVEDPDEQSNLSDAVEFLRGLLADGPVSSKQIQKDARDCGYAWRTIERAKKKLGVESRKEGGGPWLWALNSELSTEDRQVRQEFQRGNVGGVGGLGPKSTKTAKSAKVGGVGGVGGDPNQSKGNGADDDLSDVFGDAPWEPV